MLKKQKKLLKIKLFEMGKKNNKWRNGWKNIMGKFLISSCVLLRGINDIVMWVLFYFIFEGGVGVVG